MHRQHACATLQCNQNRYRVDLHDSAVPNNAAFRKKYHWNSASQQTKHALHVQRMVQIQDLMADSGQQPAAERGPGFIGWHDNHGIARQEQRKYGGVQARVMIRDDQQPVGMGKRCQIPQYTNAQKQTKQHAYQKKHSHSKFSKMKNEIRYLCLIIESVTHMSSRSKIGKFHAVFVALESVFNPTH